MLAEAGKEMQSNFFENSEKILHDIRSPLAVLRLISKEANYLPRDRKELLDLAIQRIQELTNHLKRGINDSQLNKFYSSSQILSTINSLVHEKILTHLDSLNIQIKHCVINDHECQVLCNISELACILSNFIENAIEAIRYEGKIFIFSETRNNDFIIRIEDTGCGIPAYILNKLGHEKISHGKKFGKGIGIYYANNSLAKWGASLSIQSDLDLGTQVCIKFPIL